MKQEDKEFYRAYRHGIISVAGLVLAMLACILIGILMQGCTSTKYIPVESVTSRTDTVYSVKVRVDSVKSIERVYETDNRYDSVAPILDSLNRVIGWDRYHFREVTKINHRETERLKAQVDSLTKVAEKKDSVAVPYPVERPLTKWERTKMDFGGMAIGGTATLTVVVIALAVWLVRTKRRK